MANNRGSRFNAAATEVTWVHMDEQVIPDERDSRALAQDEYPDIFDSSLTKEQVAERVRAANERNHVRDDSEVITDAVTAVVQTTDDGWIARWVIAEQDGKPIARSLVLEPTVQSTPPGGVTTNLLRELSPAQAASVAGARMSNPREPAEWPVDLTIKWARRDIAESPIEANPPARGRPRHPDELLRDLALAYLFELKAGPGVLRRLAAEFGRPEDTIRDWIRAARQRGWLGPAPKQGKSGGEPGPLLLAENDKENPS